MERPFLAFLRYEAGWEALWAPYDEATHLTVLEVIRPEDIVLDIGGGDHNLSVAHAALPAIRRETEARWRMGPEVVDSSGFRTNSWNWAGLPACAGPPVSNRGRPKG